MVLYPDQNGVRREYFESQIKERGEKVAGGGEPVFGRVL